MATIEERVGQLEADVSEIGRVLADLQKEMSSLQREMRAGFARMDTGLEVLAEAVCIIVHPPPNFFDPQRAALVQKMRDRFSRSS